MVIYPLRISYISNIVRLVDIEFNSNPTRQKQENSW